VAGFAAWPPPRDTLPAIVSVLMPHTVTHP